MNIPRTGRLGAAFAALVLAAGTAQCVAIPGASAAPAGTRHVIVRSADADLAALRTLIVRDGGHVDRTLGLIHAVSATVPAAAVAALSADRRVAEVTSDARVELQGRHLGWSRNGKDSSYDASTDADSMYRIESIIGARDAWRTGDTGKGVDIALVDSGVANVPGLNGANVVLGPDLTEESQDPTTNGDDTYGHGTHLAGIIAGHDPSVTDVSNAASDSADFLGVAPDSRIVSVKVADGNGVTDVSQVIAGIDWVVQHAHDNGMNIRVMNLSFGTDSTQPYSIDPLAYAAEQAWRHGIVVVTSAGNGGNSAGQLSDPATDPFVIAVGADDANGTLSTRDDAIPSFSAVGDGTRNPDLVAPGVHVQSLRDPGSTIDNAFSPTGAINDRFFRGSGTSQAAAVVSGAAALILAQRPDLTPDQVKYLLVSNASALPKESAASQGAGLVTVPTSIGAVPAATQTFRPSTGTGKLELSRGSAHVVFVGPRGLRLVLVGERDIFGQPVDTSALAALEANASAWNGGTFNGIDWTGNGWTSSSWASSSWASSTWRSSTWASSTWASSTWASSTWASSTWASSTWASSTWASSTWASSTWADSSWQ